MKKLKIYIAGKVSPSSSVGDRHDWRDDFCEKLTKLSGFKINNLDPMKKQDDFNLDENDSKLVFGRDCFMIKSADLIIVNLTNDISVGGSQEMLIAKYYQKPLIGIALKEGKFFKSEKDILGKTYKNWVHPFVSVSCDAVVEDLNEAADFIKNFFSKPDNIVKNISVIDESLIYYQKHHHKNDQFLHNL